MDREEAGGVAGHRGAVEARDRADLRGDPRDPGGGTRRSFPDWSEEWIESWKPPHEFPVGAKFAELAVNVRTLAGRAAEGSAAGAAGPGGVFAAAGADFSAAGLAAHRGEGVGPAGGDGRAERAGAAAARGIAAGESIVHHHRSRWGSGRISPG